LGITDLVRFVPPVSQADLAGWYAAATTVAVPSYNESFGLVAAEAQACGVPVVAAAVGGLTTVVRDERSGLLLDTHDPLAWSHALERVVSDAALRDRLAAGALVQAEQFTWEETARQTLEVYRRAARLMRAEGVA
ncbi:MAG TPA: glycosyltransferase, partial [Nocardioides sp.]|nr:glycosyltransferase [Nocardioides sp.]